MRMSRWVTAGCFAALLLSCFGGVLVRDRVFSYRDSAEFHEPLARLARQEWLAGRLPLWDPTVNSGVPLLGNPAAAVLYPGKILELLPLPWGGRLYVVAHVMLAFFAARAMLRGWDVSREGANLGAAAYAFGAPVLFQYSNVIYLVGAAWLPLGFRAVDRLVRLKRRAAVAELAAVLALIALGGDPESAYLLVGFGSAYALGLACRPAPEWLRVPGGRLGALAGIVAGLVVWVGLALLAARGVKASRWWFPLPAEGSYPVWYQAVLAACWGAAGLWWVRRSKGGEGAQPLAGLAGAVLLALGIGAMAIWPALEFSRLSVRSAEGSAHAIYPFSVEPYRAVEWFWPGFFGPFRRAERHWLHLLPPRHVVQTWTPSLYLGGLTLLLAAAGASSRDRNAPWRVWLTAVGVGSALAALGEYASPVWWARGWPGAEEWLGMREAGLAGAGRIDGGVSDGAGGVYWLLAAVLPGFDAFRYPGKLLTFTSLALAGLAGAGWDRVRTGRTRAPALARSVLIVSLVGLFAAILLRGPAVAWLGRAGAFSPTPFGPFDAAGAWGSAARALGQGVVASALALMLIGANARGKGWAGPAALMVLSMDLIVANSELVVTAPQEAFETPPAVVKLIEEAERRDPSPGPFRVHRLSTWFPPGGFAGTGADPLLALTRWELDTAKPRTATRWGLSYTLAGGGLELADYSAFLGGFYLPLDLSKAPLRGAVDGQPVLYYTRRGYDLWGTRYFILPMEPNGWQDATRGVAAFLAGGDTLAPGPDLMTRPENAAKLDDYIKTQDWMLLRNRAAFPRAWVVHRARFEKPIGPGGDDRERRERVMEQILYADDPIWSRPNMRFYDPHTLAWVETEDPKPLAPFVPGPEPAADARESAAVKRLDPTTVELEARLARPGLVVLADVNYPGWTLTVDGRPAEILRVNRLMRGAAVDAGTHRLIYTYEPVWLLPCAAVSLAGVVATVAWALSARKWP